MSDGSHGQEQTWSRTRSQKRFSCEVTQVRCDLLENIVRQVGKTDIILSFGSNSEAEIDAESPADGFRVAAVFFRERRHLMEQRVNEPAYLSCSLVPE